MKTSAKICFGITLATVIIFSACKDDNSSATERKNGYTVVLKDRGDSLYHHVMKGHDTGMAKMSTLSGGIKKMEASLDSLKKSTRKNKTYESLLISIKEDLQQAEFSMNSWMEEFKLDSAQEGAPNRIPYLELEKVKIDRMKERILSSLARLDSLKK